MKLKILLTLILTSLNSFGADFVDLGQKGNEFGVKTYKNYLAKDRHCEFNDTGLPRVLISSFGPFKNNDKNISEAVLENFLNEKLTLNEKSFGGEIKQKTVNLFGTQTEICFLNLEVFWDLSAAIILKEAELFKPDLIIMIGQGKTGEIIIESGAKNTANMLNGFNYSGKELGDLNTPISFELMHSKNQAKRYELMTWKSEEIHAEIKSLLEEYNLVFDLSAPKTHRKKNIYICNAVSFTVLHSLVNPKTYLFKDHLEITNNFDKNIKAGFLHLPKLEMVEQTPKVLEFLTNSLKKAIFVNL